jgi:PPM family protein phosphatase
VFDFFKKLFPEKEEGDYTDDSATQKGTNVNLAKVKPTRSQMPFRVVSCQSTGMERSHNEDTLFVFQTYLDGIDNGMSLGLYLVADGMGGHQNGEVASHLAAQGAGQFLMEQLVNPLIFEHKGFKEEDISALLTQAVEQAQSLVRQRVPGGGTTLTLALIMGDRVFTAHVGDSRLYLIRKDGFLSLQTKDHSLVKRLVDLGEITEAEAAVHPQRNVLYKALGQSDALVPDLDQFKIAPEEGLLLCSDGLWGLVNDQKIKMTLSSNTDLNKAACELVRLANEAGGPDNISVIIVKRIA